MTDKKEIIVHGVDVSECEKLAPYNGYDEETKCNPSCCQNSPNCEFKQLKRKEQEEENTKLKQELQEVKEELYECRFDRNIAQLEAHQYKQVLDEIEEFCTVYSADHDAYEMVYKDILDIINKSEEV